MILATLLAFIAGIIVGAVADAACEGAYPSSRAERCARCRYRLDRGARPENRKNKRKE